METLKDSMQGTVVAKSDDHCSVLAITQQPLSPQPQNEPIPCVSSKLKI